MALPKKRHSTRRKGKRRRGNSTFRLPALVVCSNCKAHTYPNTVCINCGYYKKAEVIAPKTKAKNRKSKR